jgi:hypothetical protein
MDKSERPEKSDSWQLFPTFIDVYLYPNDALSKTIPNFLYSYRLLLQDLTSRMHSQDRVP